MLKWQQGYRFGTYHTFNYNYCNHYFFKFKNIMGNNMFYVNHVPNFLFLQTPYYKIEQLNKD